MVCRKLSIRLSFFLLSLSATASPFPVAGEWSGSESTEITLPKPQFDSETSVERALKNRRSIRSFEQTPLTLVQVSQLLWAAYGITERAPDGDTSLHGGKRTVPSAGGLYPLEIYLVAGDVVGLVPGVYRYDSEQHRLEEVQRGDRRDELSRAASGQKMIREAPAVIVYSAVFERTTQKYGNRGRQRYVWMEVGHSAQNLYLQAYSLHLAMCVMGGFSDRDVKKVVTMPRTEEPLYLVTLGRKGE